MSGTKEPGATANFCGKCGTQIQGASFCTNCGTPSGFHQAITPEVLAAAAAASASAPAPSAGATPAVEPPSSSNGHGDQPTEPLEPAADPAGTSAAETTSPDDTVPPPPARPASSPSPAPGRGRGRWALIGGIGAALAVAAVVLVFVLTSGSGDDPADKAAAEPAAERVYQEQVAVAFGPVLGANQKVTEELESLSGTKPNGARLAVRQAQQATTEAQGALRALNAPDGQEALAAKAQQVLDRQTAYLEAVSAVLAHPTVAGASQLQTLSSNLMSAFTDAGPAVAGEEQTVGGADRLTSWSRTTSRKLQRQAAAKRAKAKRTRERSSNSGSGNSSSTPSAPSGNSCGGGVYAGPNTSCSFAVNVRDAYYEAPGAAASVRVYSPVTDETYTMSCRPSGSGVTCSGGNNASVTF